MEEQTSFEALKGHYEKTELWEEITRCKEAANTYVGIGLKLHGIIIKQVFPSLEDINGTEPLRLLEVFCEGLREMVKVQLAPVRVRFGLEGIETDTSVIVKKLPDEDISLQRLQQFSDLANEIREQGITGTTSDEADLIPELIDKLEEAYEAMRRLERNVLRQKAEEMFKGMLPANTRCKFCPS